MINDTSGNTFKIPTIDDTSVTVEAYTEGTQPTDDDGKDAISIRKLWARWSAELNAETVLKMNFLGRLIGERNARIAYSKLTTGPSSCDFEGIVTNCATCVTPAKATTFMVDEIIYLVQFLNPAYRIRIDEFMIDNNIL